ncbi:MAG: hypothetical protein HY078_09280 [Elusimicrobia bacterium]|nr:hypothetical protein [Elusimicrobiota bacterium]
MNKLALTALLAIVPLGPASAEEKPRMTSVPANVSTDDLLKMAQDTDTRVVVILKNGSTTYNGWVKDLSSNAVVLKNAHGKEMYEVWVLLSEIAVVEVRVK